ncbi:MAG: diguanylate cyclase precursor [Herbinix sp.]|jgi:diguanylate cyclase (GGDEF)-like protein|nr:diguanylate cyclase precursor [Herbinix sp.]
MLNMSKIYLDKKSIIYRVTSLVIIVIVAQAVLLSVFLVLGGVLSQARKNAYSTFSDKVLNRQEYLLREMSTRWTNLEPYLSQISGLVNDAKNSDQFFAEISDKLISIMRSTQATGVFVILNSNKNQEYPAIYLRDYDPVLNDYDNKDLYMLLGPSEIANNMQIPLDQMWRYKADFQSMEHDFYQKSNQNVGVEDYSNPMGYWSLPFQLFPDDIPILTYSEPLMTNSNELIGVIGVEVSLQYFKQFLPATDLQNRDSLGYAIAYQVEGTSKIVPILRTRAIQDQILKQGEDMDYVSIDEDKNIYLLKNQVFESDVYFCMKEMNLYNDNTPFQNEQWYLIGLMRGSSLLEFVNKLQSIMLISLLTSIVIGIIGGYLVSYRFTRPIILLARKVKNSDLNVKLVLEKTGLTEVDELSQAIQTANDSLLESTIKMSAIMELAELPIGAYEYHTNNNYVFMTEQVMSILYLSPEEAAILRGNKELFQNKILEILKYQDPEEENVYNLPGYPNRWVKLKEVTNEKAVMGIVIDVTDEMIEKKKMIYDRDYDYLTKILNRKALYLIGKAVLTKRDPKLEAAVMMFDLDNLKIINDTYGHKWGDKYIKQAVYHLKSFDNERMILGRRSGDEFVTVLYNYQSKDEIRSCIKEFYERINATPIQLPDNTEKTVQITAGLVWVNDFSETFDNYLLYADTALYRAKKENKGSCMEYQI